MATYNVTLVTPDGEQSLSVADDQTIFDSAKEEDLF